jgi:hypothetical protein
MADEKVVSEIVIVQGSIHFICGVHHWMKETALAWHGSGASRKLQGSLAVRSKYGPYGRTDRTAPLYHRLLIALDISVAIDGVVGAVV